jgi:hypothetical protein
MEMFYEIECANYWNWTMISEPGFLLLRRLLRTKLHMFFVLCSLYLVGRSERTKYKEPRKEDLVMKVLRLVLLISLLALTASAQQISPQQDIAPASCPVTIAPATPLKLPPLYKFDEDGNSFLIGTEKLWTGLRKSGVWYWAPHKPGHENDVQPLTEKTFWWSVDFRYDKEWRPKLKVTGRRLDGPTRPLLTLPTTNAFPGPTAAMLVGVYVPTPGCWEITGKYRDQKLSFVVWLQPVRR